MKKKLEALKRAWDEAEAKVKAEPDKKENQVAAAEAKKAYDELVAKMAAGGSDDDEGDDPDEENPNEDDDLDGDDPKWDDKTKQYIKKLRDENASHRNKNKELSSKFTDSEKKRKAILKAAGIEEESETPEDKVKNLTAATDELAFRNAVLEHSIKHRIDPDQVKYFGFLIREELENVKEGEELEASKIEEIAKQCKKIKPSTTSVTDGKNGGSPKPKENGGTETYEDFLKMTILERSAFFVKNEELCNKYMKQARSRRQLI